MEQLSLFNMNEINRFDYKLDQFVDVTNESPLKTYSYIETFAGAGGLSLGLEQAGFHSLAEVEIDKYAAETLRLNRPEWNVIEKDINDITLEDLHIDLGAGELDILSGGYPCQSFSVAGLRKGLDDVRGTLFYRYAWLLNRLKPKMFIAENVKGLVNHDQGNTLTTMIEVFQREGYTVQWNVLNAWDYDVAQKRERIFIIGIRNDLIEKEDISYAFPKKMDDRWVLRDVLKDVPESEGASYPEHKKVVMDLVPAGGCWVDLPDEVAKEYMGKSYYSGGGRRGIARRLSWDEPSLTLTTSPAQKQTERCHPSETRPFTIREYARIQGFPDDWIFYGSMNNQYKQIGNAVPINLAKYVGLSVVKYLNQF